MRCWGWVCFNQKKVIQCKYKNKNELKYKIKGAASGEAAPSHFTKS